MGKGRYLNIMESGPDTDLDLSLDRQLASFFELYWALCAIMYNYAPASGHPGGSISSGAMVSSLLFGTMAYDFSNPEREDADIISYAAGHKALGLYSLWALRDEIARIAAPELLPASLKHRLRLEDLLGFRRNPITDTPLFSKFYARALDGHPTPAIPFIKLSTGASGVGVASSLGLAFAAIDYFGSGGNNAPHVHIIEGEGGLTPGRVHEAIAAAATAQLSNAVLHIDWNQSSIDSDRVCPEGDTPGDYVQWTPVELFLLHGWNVVEVPDGFDFQQIREAQKRALEFDNRLPTAIVYHTVKGWNYGIEGRKSHGAGHNLCSEGFYKALKPLMDQEDIRLPVCANSSECGQGADKLKLEECFFQALTALRAVIERRKDMTRSLGEALRASKKVLDARKRKPRNDHPRIENIYAMKDETGIPKELSLLPGQKTTLRDQLGKCLSYLNNVSGGSVTVAAADLLGSTNMLNANDGFPAGYFRAWSNANSRVLSIGGICEDAMSGIMSGMAAYGHHIPAGSSYGAFIAALGHIASRLHAIGQQAKYGKGPYHPFFLVNAHAGLKTGEDGPTHADPQCLQLLSENFPLGTMITLTPWDPQEIWPLVREALKLRPAVIAPFVTRPTETVLDRKKLGLADIASAADGVYLLRPAGKPTRAAVVLQGSDVAYAFLQEALPALLSEGIEINVWYVSSAELYDIKKPAKVEAGIENAMGITGFTLPTLYKWIRSDIGRRHTMHPYRDGHYLGSGQAEFVVKEAHLDGISQYQQIKRYVMELET